MLSSDSTGGKVPATVNFDASASRYADDSALVQSQYTFVFGKGERLLAVACSGFALKSRTPRPS